MTRIVALGVVIALIAACSSETPVRRERTPEDVRAMLRRLIPSSVQDRAGWAADLQAAYQVLGVPPSNDNLCASLAVIEQESGYKVDPPVPGLGKIARDEIDRRAGKLGIPSLVVSGALLVKSSDGRSYADRIDNAHTEGELSRIYEDLVERVPMGHRLLTRANPVHTAGPMQVSVDFAERFSASHAYPYANPDTVRHELFTRRGGVYYGVAHLFVYPNHYPRFIYRFADFNAGQYASRNAAFQNAASIASGVKLALDGDLVTPDKVSATETVARSLRASLGMDDAAIHAALQDKSSIDFESTQLYLRMFALAEQRAGHALPRAMIPQINLVGPKITRKLTTEWYANSVEKRYRSCMARAIGG
ncbi:DUF1615 domain-containing protein [Lysobacter silvestris]